MTHFFKKTSTLRSLYDCCEIVSSRLLDLNLDRLTSKMRDFGAEKPLKYSKFSESVIQFVYFATVSIFDLQSLHCIRMSYAWSPYMHLMSLCDYFPVRKKFYHNNNTLRGCLKKID